MDLNQIRQILNLVREHELSEFEIEHDGLRLKIRKDRDGTAIAALDAPAAPAVPAPPAPAGPQTTAVAVPVQAADAADGEVELAVVKSPIVGTFYRSSEPGSASFVEI